MTRTFASCLVLVACSSDPIPLEQACAEGQRAISGWLREPTSLLEYWEARRDTHIAVLARRASAPELVPLTELFSDGFPDYNPVFYTCVEAAEHEVIDGLGWTDAERIVIGSSTGDGFFGSNKGRPLRDVGLVASEHFYEDYLAIAPDDDVYLLILQASNDLYYVRWRASMSDGMVSGDNTASGEPTSVELFRR